MLGDLEQRLNAEIKSVTDGNQSLTNTTLDLQTQKDDVAQMQDAASKVGTEVEALTVELGAPRRIRDHRECRPPSHQGRKEAVGDHRDDHRRLVLWGPLRDCFP